jgi:hypothetical protein
VGHKNHPCLSISFVSEATMVVISFGPYHPQTMGDATCAWFGRNPSGRRLALGPITTMYLSNFMVSPPSHDLPWICIYICIGIVAIFVIH